MIKNRAASLFIILLIYILAAVCGFFIFTFFASKFSLVLSLLLADIGATVVVFIFSLIFNNASVYDPYWSVQPPVILCFVLVNYILVAKLGTALLGLYDEVDISLSPVAVYLFITVLFWSIRLTANWAYNFKSFEYQDWRYVMLKEKTGRFYPVINFLGIHLFPTCVVYLCVLPAVIAFFENADFGVASAVFITLSLFAAIFQGIADIQMHKFRKSGAGGFIRTGLWKHSRHPNYACEILMWWGIGLAGVSALGWNSWYLLFGALLNTIMFLFVSIPMADKRQSKKPGFEEYKKQTRML
ncbi:MAG: DUF1295 domain-containing protein [Treponema sp.]|nr:DUF1295 domain-containing protein [Treponema sp.]